MNRLTANAADLAADYKARGIERQGSYSHFVIDRALKPELDAKQFFAIFDIVTPRRIYEFAHATPENFNPTHIDFVYKMRAEITLDADGVYHITWENGDAGTNPPSYPPEPERFKELE